MRTKLAIVVLLLLATSGANGQPNSRPDSRAAARDLVMRLSWDSVVEECRYFWWVGLTGKPAEQLVAYGRDATGELIAALDQPNRAVAAHLILCEIWNAPENCTGTIDDTQLPFTYRFGQLSFTSESRAKNTLSPAMLRENQEAWKRTVQPTGPTENW